MLTREEQKAQYTAFRAKARELFEDVGEIGSEHISIPTHANVQVVRDGAYVEAIVWVPAEKLKS